MKEDSRISSYQLFCLITGFTLGSTVILQSMTAAGRDSWISTILGLTSGSLVALMMIYLSKRFPGKTIIEYSQDILGKLPGKIIGILYLWYFLHLAALVLRNYGDFLSSVVLPESPPSFFHLTLGLVIGFMVYHKIEVVGRVGEFLLPVLLSFSLLTSLMIIVSGAVEYKNLLPVMEHGLGRVLLGTVPIASFPFQEVIVFSMLLPYLNINKTGSKAVMGGLFLAGIILTWTIMQSIAIFGPYMSTLTFPRYFSVRVITIGEFIQRTEPFVIISWIIGGLIKIGVCLYAFATGFAQLTGLKDYSVIVVPSTILLIFLADILYENVFEMLNFALNIYPIYALPFQVFFPATMILFALIRRKKGTR